MPRLPPLCLLLLSACATAGGTGKRNASAGTCAPDGGWPDTPDLDATIDDLRAEARLPGLAVCALIDGEVAWCGGYGTLRGDSGGPVTPDTPFLMASVSKLITATAVLQLAEGGDLDLDADLDDEMPFTLKHPDDPSAPITARAALAHVAGIADNDRVMDNWYWTGEDPDLPLGELIEGYFDPGGVHYDADRNFLGGGPENINEYSNMGYALLGQVVTEVAGDDFADVSRARIFEPLGMSRTSWRLADLDADTLAVPTSWSGGSWEDHGHTTYGDYPNGGLRSSACDMGRFLSAMAQGGTLDGARVLDDATLSAAMQPAWPSLDDSQGLGWYQEDLGERDLWIGHSGGEAGVATDLFMHPSGDLGIVLLANGDWDREQPIFDIEDAVLAWAKRQ